MQLSCKGCFNRDKNFKIYKNKDGTLRIYCAICGKRIKLK